MQIRFIGNVVSQKRIAGRDSSGEWDSSVFAGNFIHVLSFKRDRSGDLSCEITGLRCPEDLFDDVDFKFDSFSPYEFVVDLKEYKTSVTKEVVSFKKIQPDDKHTVIEFDLGCVI